jgi:predicted ATPase
VAIESPKNRARLIAALDSLVSKSLVSVELSPFGIRYCLLESTRTYCREKLVESEEAQLIFRRNAEHMTSVLQKNADEACLFQSLELQKEQLEYLGNLRSCLEWCFADNGDLLLGARLCAAGMPTLLRCSLLAECQRWSEAALSLVAGHQDYQWQEMVLQQGRAIASMFMAGNSGAMLTAVERALALARDLGDRRQELRMLAGLHFYRTSTDNIVGALEVAIESVALVKEMNDPAALAMAEWMLGVAYNLVGDQEAALQHCEAGMTLIDIAGRVSTICFGYDHRIRALSALTHALWLKGAHARALEMTRRTIAEAQQLGHPISYCIALSNASAIFCWNGDWDTADSLADQLCTHANRYMLTSYVAVAQALKGNVLVLRGQAGAGVALLRPCLDKLQSGPHQILKMPFITVLAEGLIALGKVEEAKAVMETAAAVGRDSYHAPEILRVQNILSQHNALAVS